MPRARAVLCVGALVFAAAVGPGEAQVRLVPIPNAVVNACQRAQARVDYPFLCPSLLPRPSRAHFAGSVPYPLGARAYGETVDAGYSGESGQALALNHPAYFLHFVIGRAEQGIPRGARPARLGGLRGLLLPASSTSYFGPYFANHVRFFWRANGIRYVATLHTFGERATERLLGRLLRTLRPARELEPYRPGGSDAVSVAVPEGPGDLALGLSGVYVTSRGTLQSRIPLHHEVTRIDPGTLSAHPIRGLGDRQLHAAYGEGALWTVSARYEPDSDLFTPSELARIDPETDRVTARLRLGRKWSTQATGLAAGAGSVWVALTRFEGADPQGVVWRVDPVRLSVLARIEVGSFPSAIAVGGDSVWVVNSWDGTVSRIDPATSEVTDTVFVGRASTSAALAEGSLWVASGKSGVVHRVDTAARRVAATITTGGPSYGIATDDRGIWVALPGEGLVERIDPRANRVVERISVGGDPIAVASDGRSLWVAMSSDALLMRIDRWPLHM
jgi:YVTN family beta-propeller protein